MWCFFILRQNVGFCGAWEGTMYLVRLIRIFYYVRAVTGTWYLPRRHNEGKCSKEAIYTTLPRLNGRPTFHF